MILEKYIKELTNILKRETLSFNTIIELLILEQKGLIECDNELLINVLERQEDVFSSIACLEKSRVDVIAKISKQIEEDSGALTVSRIVEMADEPLKNELIETAHVLSKISEDIKQKKTANAMLIKQGILIVENNIRFILKALGKDDMIKDMYSSYADSGQISGSICVDGRM